MLPFLLFTTLWRRRRKVWKHQANQANQVNLKWWSITWPICLSEVGVKSASNVSQSRIPAGLCEVSPTSSSNGLFVHWRQTWRATNHLHECCGRREWLGTFSCCSLQGPFSLCRFGNLEELLASCKRVQNHPWSNWPKLWLAKLEDFLTEVHQQDGHKHRGLSETCRPLCMLKFAHWLPMSSPGMETLKSLSTVHFIHGFSDMRSGWSTDTCKNLMGWPLTSEDGTANAMVPGATLAETLMFRVSNVGKTQLSWRDGIWLGRDTESDTHFVAVFKTRSIRRNIPSNQSSLEFLQSITATPWDPTGCKSETDAFILPLSKDDPQPLSDRGSIQGRFCCRRTYGRLHRAGESTSWWPGYYRPKRAKWHIRHRHFPRRHAFAGMMKSLLMVRTFHSRPHRDPSATLERKHEHEPEEAGIVPRSSDFRAYSLLQLWLELTFHHIHGCFESLGLVTMEFHLLTPSMDWKYLFRWTKMKRNFVVKRLGEPFLCWHEERDGIHD